jgi:hypothetical protein
VYDSEAGSRLGLCERQLAAAGDSATTDTNADAHTSAVFVHHSEAGARLGVRERRLAAAAAD